MVGISYKCEPQPTEIPHTIYIQLLKELYELFSEDRISGAQNSLIHRTKIELEKSLKNSDSEEEILRNSEAVRSSRNQSPRNSDVTQEALHFAHFTHNSS